MIWLLLVLALLPGCSLVDGISRYTGRTFDTLTGAPPSNETDRALSMSLELGMLADSVVTQIVQKTAQPLDDATSARQREVLLRLRVDYASALWNAASGPTPYANAITMLVTLAVAQRNLHRSDQAEVLGAALAPIEATLESAKDDAGTIVQTFLDPAEYEALRAAIAIPTKEEIDSGQLFAIDLGDLLTSAGSAGARGSRDTNLLRVLGMDPFAGLDPTMREIAQSRQFGERLLFNLQRMPFLMRMNAELLANDVARDVDLERVVDSLEVASGAMRQVATVAAALPGQLDSERARLVADVRAEADRLGTLARDYRGAFDAANGALSSANQALLTFGTVVDRFDSPDAAPAAEPGRPFDITEYARTATSVGDAALNLAGLLRQLDGTLDSPGVARLSPQLDALINDADARGRNLLYTTFALLCALIVVASAAVVVTALVLKRVR